MSQQEGGAVGVVLVRARRRRRVQPRSRREGPVVQQRREVERRVDAATVGPAARGLRVVRKAAVVVAGGAPEERLALAVHEQEHGYQPHGKLARRVPRGLHPPSSSSSSSAASSPRGGRARTVAVVVLAPSIVRPRRRIGRGRSHGTHGGLRIAAEQGGDDRRRRRGDPPGVWGGGRRRRPRDGAEGPRGRIAPGAEDAPANVPPRPPPPSAQARDVQGVEHGRHLPEECRARLAPPEYVPRLGDPHGVVRTPRREGFEGLGGRE